MSSNQSTKLYESLKQLSKIQFDEICFYLQKENGYDLNLISLDKVPLADSAMQLVQLLEQYADGFNHLQNALEIQGQSIKIGNPLMRQKSTLIIISLLGLLILFIVIHLIKGGNKIDIDIDGNQQGPIHIEQGNSYGILPDRFQHFKCTTIQNGQVSFIEYISLNTSKTTALKKGYGPGAPCISTKTCSTVEFEAKTYDDRYILQRTEILNFGAGVMSEDIKIFKIVLSKMTYTFQSQYRTTVTAPIGYTRDGKCETISASSIPDYFN